jgi:hypothetical protein
MNKYKSELTLKSTTTILLHSSSSEEHSYVVFNILKNPNQTSYTEMNYTSCESLFPCHALRHTSNTCTGECLREREARET